MKHLVYIGILLLCLSPHTRGKAQSCFSIMFYNVENLFDCSHDSLKKDYEFLPTSVRAWHRGRYKQKINQISKVIVSAGKWNIPTLVGLCEVENEKVMNDLIYHSPLKELGYKYVMTDSPDERGIDVALLYQRGDFKLLNYHSVRIVFKEKGKKPTRDILHASGLINTKDTLDIFVVHLPSRSGGEKESEPARLYAASVLREQTDSLFRIRMHPNIVIMGDFNDSPQSRSVVGILKAGILHENIAPRELYNLMANKKEGSYKYREEWNTFDQLIVSGYMLCNKSFQISPDNTRICNLPFLLQKDDKYGGQRPFRTYHGLKYIGGFSDHLPIITEFLLKE